MCLDSLYHPLLCWRCLNRDQGLCPWRNSHLTSEVMAWSSETTSWTVWTGWLTPGASKTQASLTVLASIVLWLLSRKYYGWVHVCTSTRNSARYNVQSTCNEWLRIVIEYCTFKMYLYIWFKKNLTGLLTNVNAVHLVICNCNPHWFGCHVSCFLNNGNKKNKSFKLLNNMEAIEIFLLQFPYALSKTLIVTKVTTWEVCSLVSVFSLFFLFFFFLC